MWNMTSNDMPNNASSFCFRPVGCVAVQQVQLESGDHHRWIYQFRWDGDEQLPSESAISLFLVRHSYRYVDGSRGCSGAYKICANVHAKKGFGPVLKKARAFQICNPLWNFVPISIFIVRLHAELFMSVICVWLRIYVMRIVVKEK